MEQQRHLFDLPDKITYFNTASYAPSFAAVEQAGIAAIKRKSHPYNIRISHFFEPLKEVKRLFAKLVEIDNYERIVTIPSVSYGMATVANNITLKETDEILLIEEQFPSNYYIWEKLAKKYNARIKIVPQPKNANRSGQQWNEDILAAINPRTAVVAMGQVHWSNGTLFDLKRIRTKTKQCNSLLIVDGSQSVGALPFSVKDLQPDALICAGYKWLFGPYGCAYAYYGPYFDGGDPIEENWINRHNSEDFTGLTAYTNEHKPYAHRYSAGEAASFIYIQMQIAALRQLLVWTPQAIQNYCEEISSDFVGRVEALGFAIENAEDRAHHMFGIELPNHTDIEGLQAAFAARDIYISFRGNYLRISCHLFNSAEDFEQLYDCLVKFV